MATLRTTGLKRAGARAPRQFGRIIREQLIGYGAALAAVAVVSSGFGLLVDRVTLSNISMLKLIVVVATARAFGSGPAVLASVAAYFLYDWFFVEPLYALGGTDRAQWLELMLFLSAAFITGQVTADQRRRARQAEQREKEAVILCDVARLVGDLDLDRVLGAMAERLRRELQLAAVAIELDDGEEPPIRAMVGDARALPPPFLLADRPAGVATEGEAPYPSPPLASEQRATLEPSRAERATQAGRPGHEVLVVPVMSQERRVGTILLSTQVDATDLDVANERLMSAVAAQLGHAFERHRLRRESTEAEILRRSDELKTALLNTVSHDLRTPLASILASGESLLEKDVEWTGQDRDEFATAIVGQTRRLSHLVSNLLDLSRIEGGCLRPKLDWYPLGMLVKEVLGRLRSTTEQHAVVADIEKDLPPVEVDHVQIDQVLSNLIENAAKYSPAGTEIRVSVRRQCEEIRVEVADRGPGIPRESIPLLFQPFHRLEGPGPRAKGIGLGLAVAKGLVEAHGGRIWMENRPDGGASFLFALPLPPDGHVSEALRESQE